jgi:hypothetical protein
MGRPRPAPLALLLALSPAILYDATGISNYANGASDVMAYDDHDGMQCR